MDHFEANFTTDANGEAVTGALEMGTYYVKQIQAPDGYLLNTTTQTVTVLKRQSKSGENSLIRKFPVLLLSVLFLVRILVYRVQL